MSDTTALQNSISRMEIIMRSARLGAEIKNVRLSGDLPDEIVRAINRALLEHKVIFFRDQNHLDDAEQERFAVRLGLLVAHPTAGIPKETDCILELDSARGGGYADQWNTDVTFADTYPKISVLRSVLIPEFGGDTIWSNTASAYLDLPAPLQKLADDLWAIHSKAYDYAVKSEATAADRKHFEEISTATIKATEHPVVRIHPETGERTLVLANSVQRFVGLQKATSQKLFDIFQSYITSSENTVRWSWKAGDVAIWDNRATQHYTANDFGDRHRAVRRATKERDEPVSADRGRKLTPIRKSKARAAKAA
ncbi:TauD/TfdA dioxygenase family protein [Bradyrhizobium iriomotense]|uniref:Taurine catabolism dioxygenase n=1 Tax=Bradyrhizobium iriomotense TaxID=441950 RepID=A0ABQ6B7J6_9BRAD|nr:TauD/TfdA family dioxygenase [Bradyrhizobium iriomotense]GLR89748.1 taurine catabolism dioxygenase [Bradyrhizobium iriomotense]